jgi:hypothetical protein
MITHVGEAAASDYVVNPRHDVGSRWRLGLVTDRAGQIHLGASVPTPRGQPEMYMDLLAPVGARRVADIGVDDFAVIVHGDRIADLRRIVVRCIDDARLRQRLLELLALSESRP